MDLRRSVLVGLVHGEDLGDGGGHAADVPRVDEHGAAQALRRAGELTENERTVVALLAHHVLVATVVDRRKEELQVSNTP